MRPLTLSLIPLLALACAHPQVQLAASEQSRAQRELVGQRGFLRVAVNVGPLWSDTTRAFLSDRPAGEIDLVERPGGEPIRPTFERVLPPGNPLRVKAIEFPDTFVMAQRVLVTPRYHPWVYLELEGDRRPYVVVLPQEVKSADDARAELERYVSADDPRPTFNALPQEQKDAILRKEATPGMSGRALEMAWGLPERKRVDRPAGTEEWTWAGDQRKAFLRDDRVERVEKR